MDKNFKLYHPNKMSVYKKKLRVIIDKNKGHG